MNDVVIWFEELVELLLVKISNERFKICVGLYISWNTKGFTRWKEWIIISCDERGEVTLKVDKVSYKYKLNEDMICLEVLFLLDVHVNEIVIEIR